ncbi:MAG: DegT/DnrJ/EryC1/StrS family aminotransferase [Microthrixaceae bacterium]|nr:DegT/DnrJ/EryC1/StrS family aminotransferase [Microthrixaceae bacterium]MCB9401155.1 DegT/DnrJ/EryC1/StrS family aminotransferase [Microthrixaceae bacterium]
MTAEDDLIHFGIPEITDDDVAAVARVLRSGWLTTGSECAGLEAELSDYLGGSEVIAMSSGTAALDTALAYLDLPRGARVGVPDWTFVATALAAVHNGLRPVLLDVDAATLNLSPEALAAEIDDLDAVLPVHFGGVPVDAEIHQLAADAGVPVVEDAAHALGARDDRGLVGGPGTSPNCFSFYASKNLTSGEGGALATDDEDLAAFARSYRLHGMDADAWARYHPGAKSGYDVVRPGIKANLPDVLAVLARSQFARFEQSQRRRRQIGLRYRAALADAPVTFIPDVIPDGSADHLAIVALRPGVDRDAVQATMSAQRITTSVHFRPLHHFSWFRSDADVGRSGLGTCDDLADRALSLPLHVNLTDVDVDRVAACLSECLR